jgi:hypothetical protein
MDWRATLGLGGRENWCRMWLALYGIFGRYRHKSTAGATNRNISSKYHVTCNGGTPAPFTVVRLDDVECFPTASPAGEAEAALAARSADGVETVFAVLSM